ncbi:MAG TPA: branched-chain amino acid ABC transporter permease [Hyphomicrobiaceae bacterium]
MLLALLISGLALGSIYALLGLSLVLVNKATDVVNFAQGEMAMFGAFIALSMMVSMKLPLMLVFVLAFPIGMLMGALIERIMIRPIRNAPHLNLLIVTIGLWFAFNSLAGLIWGYDPYRFPSLLPSEPVDVFGTRVFPASLGVIGIAIVIMAGLYYFFEHTREGTAMRAASMNPRSARLMGIKVTRVAMLSWALSSGLGTVSAMLIAPITFLDQQMMVPVVLKAFAGAILGGFSSLPGAVLGGVILGLSETLLGAYVSNAFKEAFAFLLIIAVLMIKPTGVLGRTARKKV